MKIIRIILTIGLFLVAGILIDDIKTVIGIMFLVNAMRGAEKVFIK